MAHYLIIGASSGIGKALTQQLALEGHTVTGTYFQHKPAEGESVSFQYFNANDPNNDLSWLPAQLDGLAYCPGSIRLKPFHRFSQAEWMEDLQLQLLGAVRILQATYPLLKASGEGSVVLFSTVAATVGMPFHTLVASCKAAIEGLTRSLAAEWSPAIRVNSIAPSLTDTPLAASLVNSEEKRLSAAQRHPLKRIGTPADIATAAAWLLTAKSSWVTGQVLHIDGGMSSLKL